MTKESVDALERAFEQIEGLRAFGGGALIRRALAAVAWEADLEKGIEPTIRCPIEQIQRPRSAEEEGTPLPFSDFMREIRSEQGRRTVVVDPVEALAMHLVDFYTGRITTLEYRDGGDDSAIFDQADAKARGFIREHCSLVTVNWAGAKDEQEVIDTLRATAAALESNLKSSVDLTPQHLDIMRAVQCRNERTESRPPRWEVPRKLIVQDIRIVKECKYRDHCCWNSAWTEYGEWTEKEIWRDTGRPENRPPIVPDRYIEVPWSNQIPLIPNGMNVNQTSPYGWRNLNGTTNFHGGIDIGAPAGTEVLAAWDGVISYVAPHHPTGASGVVVRDGPRSTTFRGYWHVDPVVGLAEGQPVTAGQVIGYVSGTTPEIHLHHSRHDVPSGNWWERNDGNAVNPLP